MSGLRIDYSVTSRDTLDNMRGFNEVRLDALGVRAGRRSGGVVEV